jgi:hypothetical protein
MFPVYMPSFFFYLYSSYACPKTILPFCRGVEIFKPLPYRDFWSRQTEDRKETDHGTYS